MRFELIQKLKDSKILFGIVDEYFKDRARWNALLVNRTEAITIHKIMQRCEIFEPQIADQNSSIGSPRTTEDFEFLTPRSHST
jgi:hypothetical protein